MNEMISPSQLSPLEKSVARARCLLNEGDVFKARIIAEAAYSQAKTEAEFARSHKAARHLVEKARRLMGDALIIEAAAMAAIADHVDAGQAEGIIAKGGRPRGGPDGQVQTFDSLGLHKARIFEARKIRDAETARPGAVSAIVERRLLEGKSPTRASVMQVVMGRTSKHEQDISIPGVTSVANLRWYELPAAIREARHALDLLLRIHQHGQVSDDRLRVHQVIGRKALTSLTHRGDA